MARLAVESRFGSLTSYVYPTGTYSSSQLGIGSLIHQYTDTNPEDKYVSPTALAVARPVETAGAIPGVAPYAMAWSSTIDWVFLADNATGAATRRIQLYTFNRTTAAFSWAGYVTLSYPSAGTQGVYLIRALRVAYDLYTTGTASASGTAVTGGSTTWSASRLAAGSRIGFGSSDPSAITQWYEISSINSDTSITLTSTAGTVSSGSYVIEELRIITVVTNATTLTNGGVFVAKGLRLEAFTPTGTAIAAAVSTDNVRANYWLKDASTVTNTVTFGAGFMDRTDWTTHYLFTGDTIANPILFKYNLRAALTVSSGASTDAFVLKTGSGGALTGTTSQNNNGRIATAAHGPGSGIPCFYFTTTTRVYRSIDVTTILTGSTTWLADSMTEIPPGSTTTFAATATMGSIEYSSIIDKFVIPTAGRCYITEYKTDTTQLDRIMFADIKQLNQSTADTTVTPYIEPVLAVFGVWSNEGMLYLAGIGTTATTNLFYAMPLGADWEYAETTGQRCILPKMSTPNVSAYVGAYVNEQQVYGGRSGKNLGLPCEPIRLYYRTTGIDDDTGAWTLLDYAGDLASVTASSEIQFMLEWRIIGPMGIPAKVFGVSLVYDDLSTDSHYQPSVGNSSTVDKQFAWRFSTAFGTTVPRLRIRLYDAVAGGGALVDDDSTTLAGTWEKSTDGGTNWVSYNDTDKANDTTYIRFTPVSLADNIRVRALLTLY